MGAGVELQSFSFFEEDIGYLEAGREGRAVKGVEVDRRAEAFFSAHRFFLRRVKRGGRNMQLSSGDEARSDSARMWRRIGPQMVARVFEAFLSEKAGLGRVRWRTQNYGPPLLIKTKRGRF